MVASSIFRASLIVLGLLAPALAAPAAGTVLTPYGERPIADVHAVPAGGEVRHVGDEVHLVDATGTVLHVAKNDQSKVREQPTPVANAARAFQTGWIAYAYWTNTASSPISSFTTTWTVPAVPASNVGQTLFTFNSIEPASGNAILQPVLQYGPSAAGGGSYYAVASWYLVGSQTYYTSPVKVSTGATLNGVITLTSSSGSSYNYVTSFSNISGTSLTATGSAQLVWATETLEVYGVSAASQFPTGSTVFSGINLKLSSGATPSVSWSAVSSSADGVTTTINTQGATNAEVTIKY
ncbi:hypothetical protein DL93DRAFT_2097674 [Clavulina sp. PMI_390]|nr:hypothetical protein DL93DRAFT_2097674 [Clavulina sp. PMI_390]